MSLEGWQTVTNDYSKTIITLSAAFLAFTVTFWKEILPPEAYDNWYLLLVLVWCLLLIAIGAALLSAGLLVRVLLGEDKNSLLMFSANFSYCCFGLAAIEFLGLGFAVLVVEKPFTDARALEITQAAIDRSKLYPEEPWSLESFYVQDGIYTALYSNKADRKTTTVKVKRLDQCTIIALRQLESVDGSSVQSGLERWYFTKRC